MTENNDVKFLSVSSDDGNPCITIIIRDFYKKMESWASGRKIETDEVMIDGVKFWIQIYPNGFSSEEEKHVSLFLCSQSSPVIVDFAVNLGPQLPKITKNNLIGRGFDASVGWYKFCSRPSRPLFLPYSDEDLKITFTILSVRKEMDYLVDKLSNVMVEQNERLIRTLEDMMNKMNVVGEKTLENSDSSSVACNNRKVDNEMRF